MPAARCGGSRRGCLGLKDGELNLTDSHREDVRLMNLGVVELAALDIEAGGSIIADPEEGELPLALRWSLHEVLEGFALPVVQDAGEARREPWLLVCAAHLDGHALPT